MVERQSEEHPCSALQVLVNRQMGVILLRFLQASLKEVTVKDMLEGDNKYLCTTECKKPVRAEKRWVACFSEKERKKANICSGVSSESV